MDSLSSFIILIAQIILVSMSGLWLRSYLPKYFEEKGKNLATKEDIEEITRKVEAVRAEYAQLSHVHRLTFEKEFEILDGLWKALVDLGSATQGLRPILDHVD